MCGQPLPANSLQRKRPGRLSWGPVGSTWFTTLSAIRACEPDWQEIACYREPIARFLARVYPRLALDLREDVVQEVLFAMRTSVVARFDPDRGRFRDYLRGVIRNQVKKALAKERAGPARLTLDPEAVMTVDAEEVEAVDLAARLVRAVRAFHDQMLQGKDAEREVLYCLSDRLIHGMAYAEIAAKEHISIDAVKRRLQAARRGILRALLRGALDDAQVTLAERKLNKLADKVAEAVASRRPVEEVVGGTDDASRVAGALVEAVRSGVPRFPGLDSPDGQAFVTALEGLLTP